MATDSNEAWRLEADYYARAMHAARRERDMWRARFEVLRAATIVVLVAAVCVLGVVLRPHEWYAWLAVFMAACVLVFADFDGRRVDR